VEEDEMKGRRGEGKKLRTRKSSMFSVGLVFLLMMIVVVVMVIIVIIVVDGVIIIVSSSSRVIGVVVLTLMLSVRAGRRIQRRMIIIRIVIAIGGARMSIRIACIADHCRLIVGNSRETGLEHRGRRGDGRTN
jgi:hypothetical protein